MEIESVSVAYDNTLYPTTGLKKYTPCRQALDYEIRDWEYHLENQDRQNPIYFERDKSIFIAPDPRTEDI